MSAPYPWLESAWQRLCTTRNRPAQALLLTGPGGLGKGALARAWARSLLCETPTPGGDSCGACAACHWFEAGTHPDFLHVTLLEKTNREGETRLATALEVDQARQAVDFVRLSTYRAGHRVVVVEPADALNPAAANALLKVLEEPPLNTVFVLVSNQPGRLLPTIRSRCTRRELGLPDQAVSLDWLASRGVRDPVVLTLAGGAPLAALEWTEGDALDVRREVLDVLAQPHRLEPVTQAERWKAIKPALWHGLVYRWLADAMAVHLQGAVRFNPDFSGALQVLGQQAGRGALLTLARRQGDEGRSLNHPLNRALQLQAWLVEYQKLFGEQHA